MGICGYCGEGVIYFSNGSEYVCRDELIALHYCTAYIVIPSKDFGRCLFRN